MFGISIFKIVQILRDYFSISEKPVDVAEFAEFWGSLKDDELQYFRDCALVLGKPWSTEDVQAVYEASRRN
jgi:hypothetical protein